MRNWAIFFVGFWLGVIALPAAVVLWSRREWAWLHLRRARERLSVWWEERRNRE